MSRKLRPLAALAVIALISAGCSNTPAESGDTGTGSSNNKNITDRDKAVKFAECMRANGVGATLSHRRRGRDDEADTTPGFGRSRTPGAFEGREELSMRQRPGFSVEAVQTPARVNVTCVTPLGEEVASTL
jgi:hypothetical protein